MFVVAEESVFHLFDRLAEFSDDLLHVLFRPVVVGPVREVPDGPDYLGGSVDTLARQLGELHSPIWGTSPLGFHALLDSVSPVVVVVRFTPTVVVLPNTGK